MNWHDIMPASGSCRMDGPADGSAGGSGDAANAEPGGQGAAIAGSSDRGTGGEQAGKQPTIETLTAEVETLRKNHEKLTGDHKQLQQKWEGKLKSERAEAFRKGKPAETAAGEGAGEGAGEDVKAAGDKPGGAKPDSDEHWEDRYQEEKTKEAFFEHAETVGLSTDEAKKILSDIAAWRNGDVTYDQMLDLSKALSTGLNHEALLEKALNEHGEKVRLETIKQLRDDVSRGGGMPLSAEPEKGKTVVNANEARAVDSLRRLGS